MQVGLHLEYCALYYQLYSLKMQLSLFGSHLIKYNKYMIHNNIVFKVFSSKRLIFRHGMIEFGPKTISSRQSFSSYF